MSFLSPPSPLPAPAPISSPAPPLTPLQLAALACQAKPRPDLGALAQALGPLSPSPLFQDPEAHALIPCAILSGSVEALSLILAAGADPNEPSASAPLSLCVVSDRVLLCEALLAAGADPAEPYGEQAVSALNTACAMQSIASLRSLRALLAHGADPNAPDAGGRIPLLRCSSIERAQILIEAGADPLALDAGRSLHSRARALGKPELADFIASLAEARLLEDCPPALSSRPKPSL